MTTNVSLKTAVIGTLMLALLVPAMSFAATPSIAELTAKYEALKSQYQTLAATASSTASSTLKTSPRRDKDGRVIPTDKRTCMAAAVAARDTSLKSVWTTFSTSIVAALDKRSSALTTAWNASSTNQGEINKAWSTWKTDRLAAAKKLKNDRQAAWDAFRKTANDNCKVKTPKAEGLEKSNSDDINL